VDEKTCASLKSALAYRSASMQWNTIWKWIRARLFPSTVTST